MNKLFFWFCILSICLIIQGNSSAQAEGYVNVETGVRFTHNISGRKSQIQSFGDALWLFNGDEGPIRFYTGGSGGIISASMSISPEGNVGIDTYNPEQRLHITGVNPRILVEGYEGNPEVNFKNSGDDINVRWALYKESSSDDLRFYQGGDKVTIENATGNVGIGTTNPGKKLYVNGSAGGTQAWNASDKREKTEIKPIQNALDNILGLSGISYRWKKGDEKESQGFDNKTHFGVIAQDVEAVYPELVDNPGITEKRKHVEYNGLVGVLIEAVKELKVQNEKQQAEIEELQSIIKELKS